MSDKLNLSDAVDENCQFDEEVKALTVVHQLEPSELRVGIDAVCVNWDQILKTGRLIIRYMRLSIELAFEHGARRRHSLTRRLDQVKMELDGMR